MEVKSEARITSDKDFKGLNYDKRKSSNIKKKVTAP